MYLQREWVRLVGIVMGALRVKGTNAEDLRGLGLWILMF
jgi:hypothetical protein